MVSYEKGWHYLAVEKISTVLRGTTSKCDGEFYCLNCLLWICLGQKNKIESHKKIYNNYITNITIFTVL